MGILTALIIFNSIFVTGLVLFIALKIFKSLIKRRQKYWPPYFIYQDYIERTKDNEIIAGEDLFFLLLDSNEHIRKKVKYVLESGKSMTNLDMLEILQGGIFKWFMK